MYEWNQAIQKAIYWIEDNLEKNPSLLEMSKAIGYSPYYCSTKFHEIVGMTIKSYIAGRRLAKSAFAIRDTNERILDIAIKYGYSSQEALTRAFMTAFGCTPAVYRKRPCPVALQMPKAVLYPHQYNQLYQGGITMSKTCLTEPHICVEYIPAHKYIGIWEDKAHHYGEFWNYHDCDKVCGIIESMRNVSDKIVGPHMAGFFYVNGEIRYFYGLGVPADYTGEVPEGFEIKEFPTSYYLKFVHPTFDYFKDNDEVMGKVDNLAWNFDPKTMGFEWNDDCQIYHRHYPEVLGYEFLRPVKKL